jgi:hypothetical protein
MKRKRGKMKPALFWSAWTALAVLLGLVVYFSLVLRNV